MNRSVLDDGFLSDHPYFSRIAISDENHPNNFQIFILSRTALIPYIVILIPLASVQIDFSKKKIKKICQGNSISVEKQKSN